MRSGVPYVTGVWGAGYPIFRSDGMLGHDLGGHDAGEEDAGSMLFPRGTIVEVRRVYKGTSDVIRVYKEDVRRQRCL